MVERIVSMDRRIGIVVILVLTTLCFGCTAWAVSAFVGGDDNGAGEIPAGAEDWMAPLPGEEVDALGTPIPQATLIAQAVEATIAAMPTPTPEPTPDIAATLQADLAASRREVAPVIAMNPLDLESERDPYLTPSELDYFRSMGPRLWAYVRVWLHVKRIISVDVSSWNYESLAYDLDSAQAFLESAPARPSFPGGQQVDPLVREYADTLETGLTGVREAVVRLSEAREILEAGSLGHEEREELDRIVRDVERHLARFDDAMSSYGCSVCGELFRSDGS